MEKFFKPENISITEVPKFKDVSVSTGSLVVEEKSGENKEKIKKDILAMTEKGSVLYKNLFNALRVSFSGGPLTEQGILNLINDLYSNKYKDILDLNEVDTYVSKINKILEYNKTGFRLRKRIFRDEESNKSPRYIVSLFSRK